MAAVLLLALAVLAGCKKEEGQKEEGDAMGPQEVGVMLTLSAVEERHQKLVDDSGMSGSGGRIHLHSNQAADMYKGQEQEFVFDIGHIEKLGKLYFWNYNGEGNTESGLKEVKISVSEDNVTYSAPITYQLKQATGEEGLAATNLEDGSEIDLCGISGRYLKVEAVSNYGGDGYGLSELRLFRYRQQAVEGESLSLAPLERLLNQKWTASPEEYNLFNGSGLSDFHLETATHDNNPAHMFAQDANEISFIVDLQGEYPIGKVVLWNYNDPEHLDYGLKKFRLKVSDDYSIWKTIGTYTMEQADGSANAAASLVIDAENIHGHYLQIEILSNHGGEKVGLSEIGVFLGSGWYCDSVPDYTALLSRYEGWSGADGVYSVNLSGKDGEANTAEKKTFFIFSDTIVSTVDPVTKRRSNVYMPNNTSALLTGGEPDCKNITFYWPEKEEATANIIPNPLTPATKKGKFIYYWLGDTFVSGNYLYVYSLRIDSVNTMFGFDQIGVDLARYEIKNGEVDFDSLVLINDDAQRLCRVSDASDKWYFGGAVYQSTEAAGVLNPDGYVYIYGYEDITNAGRQLVVARVKPEQIEQFAAYEYLAADGSWSTEVPKEFFHLAQDVAPECSVTQITSGEHKGKFLFVNTHITNSPTIKASISDTPYGVFENKTTIFSHDDCQKLLGKGNNTYNAKAHPALSDENGLIISYNINGDDCFVYADIYRPRFLRLGIVKERE